MVPMRYHKSIFLNKIIIIFVIFITLLFASACTKKYYPNATNEFYVNDFAYAYHPATSEVIVLEGERLYEETKDIETIGGAQIVFATFIVENIEEVANYNRTDIFRQWEIGKNDMGILVLMFFSESEKDGIEYIYLEETQIEVGYRMEQYFTAVKQGQLLDDTIYSDTYEDLDMKIAYLYYEMISLVYEEVYVDNYGSFTYDMEDFKYRMDNYIPSNDNVNIGLIAWILLLFAGTNKWYIIIPAAFLLFGGGLRFRRNRGGGGSSGGYGIFRRR